MHSYNNTARLAGLVYLALIISGIFNLAYIPTQLIVWEDAAQTVENLMASELLFKWGIASGVICFLAFLVLPLVLYKLLRPVHPIYAVLMVAFAVVSVPLSFVNMQHKLDILTLLGDASYLENLTAEQIQMQVMLSLEQYSNGMSIAEIFWGLWLFPFGYLVYKSGFLPKILGILLMLGCFGYLTGFFGDLFFENYHATLIPTIVGLPATFGEIGTCLWLLIKGVNEEKVQALFTDDLSSPL